MSNKPTTTELSAIAKSHVEIKDGQIVFDDEKAKEEIFQKLDVKEKDLKKSYESVTAFNNAVRMAVGEEAIEAMAKNKELTEMTLKYNVAGEKVTMVARREKTDRNPQSGEVTVTRGAVSISRTVKGSPSENKSIREHLAAIGAKKLA